VEPQVVDRAVTLDEYEALRRQRAAKDTAAKSGTKADKLAENPVRSQEDKDEAAKEAAVPTAKESASIASLDGTSADASAGPANGSRSEGASTPLLTSRVAPEVVTTSQADIQVINTKVLSDPPPPGLGQPRKSPTAMVLAV